MTNSRTKVKSMALVGMFAAATAVLAQISIPLPGLVPVTLTHISIFLAAGLLGTKLGTISMLVYVFVGATGVPVFSGMHGGISRIVGPTGGFIIGYIACAFVTGFIIERFGKSLPILISAMLAGWVVTYLFGLSWYMYIMKLNLLSAASACFFPFIPGDILKSILCFFLISKLPSLLFHSRGEN